MDGGDASNGGTREVFLVAVAVLFSVPWWEGALFKLPLDTGSRGNVLIIVFFLYCFLLGFVRGMVFPGFHV